MDGACGGRKVVAFAITLTKDGYHLDGAAVLAASIGKGLFSDGNHDSTALLYVVT